MDTPIKTSALASVLADMGISDIAEATIRQSGAIARALESSTSTEFLHLEIGVAHGVRAVFRLEILDDARVEGVEAAAVKEAVFFQKALSRIRVFRHAHIPPKSIPLKTASAKE